MTVIKKYSSKNQFYDFVMKELELESKKLKEQLADISRRLEEMDRNKGKEGKEEATAADIQKLEIKCKELETKLDLEKTTKGRMESHISRQTDVIESLQKDLEDLAVKEKKGQDEQKKMAASIRYQHLPSMPIA